MILYESNHWTQGNSVKWNKENPLRPPNLKEKINEIEQKIHKTLENPTKRDKESPLPNTVDETKMAESEGSPEAIKSLKDSKE